MDYEVMLDYHKANKADVTIACMPVPIEEASRFGVMITDGAGRITEFEENRNIQEVIWHPWEFIFSPGRHSKSL